MGTSGYLGGKTVFSWDEHNMDRTWSYLVTLRGWEMDAEKGLNHTNWFKAYPKPVE